MIRRSLKIISGTVFLFGLFSLGCDKQNNQETGFLEGVISIGPICPVETDPPDPGCLPTAETYKAYAVSIWTSNGRKKITQIDPVLDGSYKTELVYGDYLVKLENGQNGPGGSNLPVEISIIPQNKTVLNITGVMAFGLR
ncbi:MAG TPA: hypothetical protein VMV74_11200 [Bacteroidales bacterium]|nr:hypothetical protein [Bacteroidales bacterium]